MEIWYILVISLMVRNVKMDIQYSDIPAIYKVFYTLEDYNKRNHIELVGWQIGNLIKGIKNRKKYGYKNYKNILMFWSIHIIDIYKSLYSCIIEINGWN